MKSKTGKTLRFQTRAIRLTILSHLLTARLAAAFLTVAALSGMSGCAPKARSVLVALDETFRLTRPGLCASLSRIDSAGALPGRKIPGGNYGYDGGLESLGKDIKAAAGKTPGLGVIVASPLVAARSELLPAGVPVIVADGPFSKDSRIHSVMSSRAQAYRTAGMAAGIHVGSLMAGAPLDRSADRSPGCGIIFAPSFSRPVSLIAEFEAGYREGYESVLNKTHPTAVDTPTPMPFLATEMVSTAGSSDPAKASIDFVDFTGETNAASKKLLEREIKVLFFACGRVQEAARMAAERPGIVIGLDQIGNEPVPGMAFRIVPDENALFRAIKKMTNDALFGKMAGITGIGVPSSLVAGTNHDIDHLPGSFGSALAKARKLARKKAIVR